MKKKGTATPLDVEIGVKLRAARLKLGLSQTDVADALDITFQQVQKYETGRNRIPVVKLCEVAKLFKLHITDLLPATYKRYFTRVTNQKVG